MRTRNFDFLNEKINANVSRFNNEYSELRKNTETKLNKIEDEIKSLKLEISRINSSLKNEMFGTGVLIDIKRLNEFKNLILNHLGLTMSYRSSIFLEEKNEQGNSDDTKRTKHKSKTTSC